jgi:hypothetical protein
MNLNELTLETAKPLEGSRFDLLTADGRTLSLTLDSVQRYIVQERRRTRGAPVSKREPFALYFLGSPDEVLPQSMYTVRSESLTLEGVFIVPIGRDEEATEYEAIFA